VKRADPYVCDARYERKFHRVRWLLTHHTSYPKEPVAFHYWLLMELDGARYDYPGQYAFPDKLPKQVKDWVDKRTNYWRLPR
jgi:hypothetical protein